MEIAFSNLESEIGEKNRNGPKEGGGESYLFKGWSCWTFEVKKG